jgi:hypothetical protein
MTEQMLSTLLTRIEQLSAEKQSLAEKVTHLKADRELLKRWSSAQKDKRR